MNFIKFTAQDIQTIIGVLDELGTERSEQEDAVYNKACQIAALQVASRDRSATEERPELLRDPETGRLTIVKGKKVSKPVSYKGVATMSNFFAVTGAFEGIFPTNVLLRWQHANPADRPQKKDGSAENEE
jgi:hypothetical protein